MTTTTRPIDLIEYRKGTTTPRAPRGMRVVLMRDYYLLNPHGVVTHVAGVDADGIRRWIPVMTMARSDFEALAMYDDARKLGRNMATCGGIANGTCQCPSRW